MKMKQQDRGHDRPIHRQQPEALHCPVVAIQEGHQQQYRRPYHQAEHAAAKRGDAFCWSSGRHPVLVEPGAQSVVMPIG